jgi:DNA-binding transcriptional ArsR family regulator
MGTMPGEGSTVVAIDADDADVVALLDDEYARATLVLTYREELAADDIAECLDAAPSTVYDRLSRLTDHDLVTEQQQLDLGGHHYKTYRARLDCVVTELTADGFEVRIDREPSDPADRLTAAFDDLR